MPAAARSTVPLIVSPAPEWPHRVLDVAALRADGWRPTPFRDVVLKVHQRCNLACDYCYVYEMADQSWRSRPTVMEEPVWQAAARRMAEHARAHDLDTMRLVLHGGEPLMAGADRLERLIGDFRRAFDGRTRLDVQIQTNGVLLDEPMLTLLRRHEVGIGVSLDGTAEDHDRRRSYANGRGSHDAVDRALRLLVEEPGRASFAGLLCTIDPDTDPIACYEALIAYRPPTLDLLVPHANWSHPPAMSGPTPIADWLISVFDRWYSAPRREVAIRLFDDLLALVLGGTGRSEQVGLSPVAVVVVETDGAIEQVDSLKSAYEGACATGLNVLDDPFDAALSHPGVVARQIGVEALCDTCRECTFRDECGGGHYAHRYRATNGFRNPSVYCADMLKLVGHIRARVLADLHQLSAAETA
ncbi:FxsB family cyclophane-forming radical SAM/SPASM peptide maturase [Actinoplanes solisilvae]|uniref:FxsB family cyclophane-forming radical SAM/SPASM peptide maturase n=1 Tax=Actinoplanes solisilvae TaxID=2486853 RepID=UPI000FD72BEE|nr:FxsB family cyclophane-forming radical SAM/SPASM peptide maturase [Actinoplanes solisilvae]